MVDVLLFFDTQVIYFASVAMKNHVLCPASLMNTTKIECLISGFEHDSFEHGIAELVSAPNSTAASNMQKLWCVGLSLGSKHSIYYMYPQYIW